MNNMDNIEEKIKNAMGKMDFSSLTEKMKILGANMPDIGQMKSVLDQINATTKPIAQKNIKINDRNVTLGLTNDNRVTISFITQEHSKEFYDNVSQYITKKETTWQKIKNIFKK